METLIYDELEKIFLEYPKHYRKNSFNPMATKKTFRFYFLTLKTPINTEINLRKIFQ